MLQNNYAQVDLRRKSRCMLNRLAHAHSPRAQYRDIIYDFKHSEIFRFCNLDFVVRVLRTRVVVIVVTTESDNLMPTELDVI